MNKAVDRLSYEIVPLTNDDRPTVFEFLKEFFYRQGPLSVAFNVLEDPEVSEKLHKTWFETLQDNGLSLKAVSPNGDLMGVIINDIVSRDKKEQNINCNDTNGEDQEKDVIHKQIMALFEKVENESDVWGKFPEVNRLMEIKKVAVNEVFRGQGVCKALFEKTIKLAVEHKCTLVHVECSSHFSGKVSEKLGFQCIYSLNYQDYKNDKDEVIFIPPSPHKELKVYALPV